MPADVHHPLFARFFDWFSGVMEQEVGAHRDELVAGLSGRVIEVGAGNGINFSRYPSAVEEVIALEPEPYLRARAERAARAAPVPVRVTAGVAEQLELPDASFDGAVACLVLCTVRDQKRVLAELRRVLKPGAQLRFLEHVRAPHKSKARMQRLADSTGVWPRLGGGCHCARNTVQEITSAGFHVERTRSLDFGPSWMLTNPHVLGWATN